MSHYRTLGVPPRAGHAQIRAAFRARRAALLAARSHPYRSPAHRARVEVEWRALHSAWETLGHPQRRHAYDRQLAAAAPRAGQRWVLAGMVALLLPLLGWLLLR